MFHWLCCFRRKKDKKAEKGMGSGISKSATQKPPQEPRQVPSPRSATSLQQQHKKQVPPSGASSASSPPSPPQKQDVSPTTSSASPTSQQLPGSYGVTPATSPLRGKIRPMPTPLRDLSAVMQETGAELEDLFTKSGRPSKEIRDWLARKRCDSAPIAFAKPTPIDQMAAGEKKA